MSRPLIALDARLVTTRNTGDTAYWRGLVKGLGTVASGLRIVLYSDSPRPAFEWLPDEFEWRSVPGKGRLWSLYSFPTAAKKDGASVVHTQYNLSPLVGKVGVTTIHDVSFFVGPEWFKPVDRWLLRTQIPATVSRAAKVLTVSETSKKEIVKFTGCEPGKVVVTYNALGDNVKPMPKEEAQRIVRDKLGISEPFVLTVGTRWPRKNMRLAIDAVGNLPSSMPHKIVVTGGSGWGEESKGGRTVFTGYVQDEELTALYQCAELYLAPSRHEGFGIPLLEAWACDCPVMCSTGGALPEIAGDAAHIVQGWDATDWASQLAGLLHDSSKLAELRRRGEERLRTFSWNEAARRTVDAYLEVIG